MPRGAAVAMTTGDAWGRPANDGGGAPGEQQGRTDGERTGDRHEARKHSENTARGRKPALKTPSTRQEQRHSWERSDRAGGFTWPSE